MRPFCLFLVYAAAMLGLPGRSEAAGPKFIRLSTPRIEVMTDAGERAARRVLDQFEQARRIFDDSGTFPVRVLLLSNPRDFRVFQPSEAVIGFYQSGPRRDYVAMLYGSTEVERVGMHEYTHLILSHRAAALPQWMEEGLAEVYSTIQVRPLTIEIGRPIDSHLRHLAARPWLSAETLAGVNQQSPEYNETRRVGIFYAQSWALTHMLYCAPRFQGGFAKYLESVAGGADFDDAFRVAFGLTMEQALTELHSYVNRHLPVREVGASPQETRTTPALAVMLEDEVLDAEAELLLTMHKDSEAESYYRRIAQRYPESPIGQAGLGTVAMRSRDFESARRHFARAVERSGTDAGTLFEYAMLLRDTGAPREQVSAQLLKVVQANPNLAEAQFLLGVRAAEEGRYADAVERLKQACESLPRQAYFWHALSLAYHKLGDSQKSEAAAYRVINAARTDEEKAMGKAALRLAIPTPVVNARSRVTTPSSWNNPKGDARVHGKLTQVDCDGSTARLHIGALLLTVRHPDRVVLRGAGGIRAELKCGPQEVGVAVEYSSELKEVTAIQFE